MQEEQINISSQIYKQNKARRISLAERIFTTEDREINNKCRQWITLMSPISQDLSQMGEDLLSSLKMNPLQSSKSKNVSDAKIEEESIEHFKKGNSTKKSSKRQVQKKKKLKYNKPSYDRNYKQQENIEQESSYLFNGIESFFPIQENQISPFKQQYFHNQVKLAKKQDSQLYSMDLQFHLQ